jgi:hypothetical protein
MASVRDGAVPVLMEVDSQGRRYLIHPADLSVGHQQNLGQAFQWPLKVVWTQVGDLPRWYRRVIEEN